VPKSFVCEGKQNPSGASQIIRDFLASRKDKGGGRRCRGPGETETTTKIRRVLHHEHTRPGGGTYKGECKGRNEPTEIATWRKEKKRGGGGGKGAAGDKR